MIRFHIKLESDKPALQNESSLFEVNSKTTIKNFKQLIILRLDQGQVTRTFFDQVKLFFGDDEIRNDFLTNSNTILNALGLSEESITPLVTVLNMRLEVSNNVNGSNGILSRDFIKDLIADNRFEFLPKSNFESEIMEEDDNRNNNPIENLKIIDNQKEEWYLSGDSYEKIIKSNNKETKLIKQLEISDLIYEMYDETKSVSLSTSQCIIVDNSKHQPYMILNPSGIAKLNSVFKSQKVQIMMSNDLSESPSTTENQEHQPAEPREPNNDDMLDRLVATGRSLFLISIKVGFALYMLGLKPNKHLRENWIKYLILFIVLFNMYVMYCTGDNRIQNLLNPETNLNQFQPTTRSIIVTFRRLYGITSNLKLISRDFQNELASLLTRRIYDFEFILSSEPNWWLVINSNMENIWKDTLIYILTFFPSFQLKIYDELHKHKSREFEELEKRVSHFYDLMITVSQEYNKDHDPSFNIPSELSFDKVKLKIDNVYETQFPELSTSERTEIKYEFWIAYYNCMKKSFDVLNKVFVNKNFLKDEQVEVVDNNFNRFINNRMQ
ncbi:uncharacterized protein KGF55_005410 [Candida pseudojiufengensis]|uniref:uncharacterized protein n=1 Tax=Candida pseudojiufengensis TaxID=497109 RepID=UPI0022247845|nr:uncharacterized protein KGF55_005410 [Candida pseudojiufengensis]KAI5959260.1 hypothetical protein KGF55_005410 [Candida pseudojiufengensis]